MSFLFPYLKFFLFPPKYNGQTFWQKRQESLKYCLLFCLVSYLKKVIAFQTLEAEQIILLKKFGVMAILIDDLMDKEKLTIKQIKKILFAKNPSLPKTNYLILHKYFQDLLQKTTDFSEQKKFIEYSLLCLNNNQTNERESVSELLKLSEKKGGYFALSVVHLLNPDRLSPSTKKAVYFLGSWGQLIDDYWDRKKDHQERITTVFTKTPQPKEVLIIKSIQYEQEIRKNKPEINSVVNFFLSVTKAISFLK